MKDKYDTAPRVIGLIVTVALSNMLIQFGIAMLIGWALSFALGVEWWLLGLIIHFVAFMGNIIGRWADESKWSQKHFRFYSRFFLGPEIDPDNEQKDE